MLESVWLCETCSMVVRQVCVGGRGMVATVNPWAEEGGWVWVPLPLPVLGLRAFPLQP